MTDDRSAQLMARWQDGDQQAAEEIYQRFVDRLVALASSRLRGKLQRRVAPEDVVQSVYRSFFRVAMQDRYHCEQSGDLWRLLSTITINKIRHQVEFHGAQKRSLGREDSIRPGDSLAGLPPESLAREPTPEEAAALVEDLEAVMQTLEPVHRQILQLRLQGNSVEEVADEVKRSHRTIRRVLEKVRSELSQRLEGLEPE